MSAAQPSPPLESTSTATPRGFLERRAGALVAFLLVIYGLVLVHTALENSETFDEPMYLLASRSYWERGDFSFNREHPPLSKLLIGLPLKLAGLKLQPDYHVNGATQLRFVYELNDDPERTLFLGRLPMILVGILLAFYVYRFARLFGSARSGIAALIAYMLMPGMTGNTPLAALDLGAAAFALIALYYLARVQLADRPSGFATLLAGITFGLAQLTKYTNLLLGPVYVVLAVIEAIACCSFRPLGRVLAIFLVGFSTMFAGYGFEMRTVDSVRHHPRYDDDPKARAEGYVFSDLTVRKVADLFGDHPIPMLTYLKGYDYLKRESGSEGHMSYFRGESKKGEGWKEFYLVTLLVKTPVGVLVLLALGVFALLGFGVLLPFLPRPPGRRFVALCSLLLFPCLVFAVFSFAPTQLGLRYALPVLPPLAVLVGAVFDLEARRDATGRFVPRFRDASFGRVGRVVLWVGVVASFLALPLGLAFAFPERGAFGLALILAVAIPALAAAAFFARPDCLRWVCAALLGYAAFDVAAQHPQYLMYFNAFAGGPDHGYRILSIGDDWGQGTSELAELQRERGWGRIAYDYYGTGMPEVYGLDYRAYDGVPTSGLVAVHAVQLTRERFRLENPRYTFLDGLEPIARANAIFVFDVPPAAIAPKK